MSTMRQIQRRRVLAAWAFASLSTLYGQTSVLTWHNDNARSGQNLQETTLTPANVNSGLFGKVFSVSVDGKVDAQPLYVPALTIPAKGVHNVLFVMTEHGTAYAFDADSGGAPLWQVSLLGSGEVPSDDHGCGQVTPEIGITATPVIDLQAGPHGTLYAVATSKDSTPHYHHRLHALDLTTGAEQFAGPVEVQATYAGSGAENTFNPTVHKERPGLLLLSGVVYTSWGSHCDGGSYAGWVIGYNQTTLQRVSVINLAPNGGLNGLWNAGSGPAADASGNIYGMTGNGTFDTSLDGNGFPNKGDYGNSFVKLATTGGPLRVVDYFTMKNTVSESNGDVDLGSGGLMLLPSLNDSQGQPRSLAVGAGKDGHIYVVDRTNLGKFSSSTNAIYQDMVGAVSGGVFSSPAWFNGRLYYGDVGGTLKAFTFANGSFATTPSSHSTNTFGYPGTTPSVSANGTSNGIVWAVENSGTAVLHAYDATDLSHELYNTNQAASSRDHFGAGNKYIVSTIANGKVYVGTTNSVGAFGLLCTYTLGAQSASIPVGGASQQTVSVTTSSGCAWTAASNAGFVTISAGASGTGSGTVTYQVAANSGVARSGTMTVAGQTFTVQQAGIPAVTLNLSRSTLNFGYSGSLATSAQPVTVSFSGGTGANWTATSNQTNITVSGGSGTGSGTFQVTAAPGVSGVITVTAPGAVNSPRQVQVNVRSAVGASFGSFDTPANNTNGVAGALAVTGWALDSVEVTGVGIWREPVAGQGASPNGLVFIGNAVFVNGTRPDVESAYPNAPFNYRAGWGYQMLTNSLPNGGGGAGNGTFRLHAIATNKAGTITDLGAATIIVDNAHAAKPFGTIDTPSQGGTISGSTFVNFGWALTQNPNAISINGSTITAYVDGVPLGHPTYNQPRADIANAFPGLANSVGPVGFFYIDTTTLSNGMHTISWSVTDSAGHADGIGSRYFFVANGVSGTAAPDEVSISGNLNPTESRAVEIEEMGRMQLPLDATSGFLMVNGEQRPLPIGSTLKDGVFYWEAAPGFLGKYQLVFQKLDGSAVSATVRIRPKSYRPVPTRRDR
jgi:hypothetical protein